jgi:hypothetical protein
MNKSIRIDSLDKSQNTFTSFKGYEFSIDDQKWVLDINKTIDISRYEIMSFLSNQMFHDFVHFAKYSSSSHTANMCEYIGKYFDITERDHFSIKRSFKL